MYKWVQEKGKEPEGKKKGLLVENNIRSSLAVLTPTPLITTWHYHQVQRKSQHFDFW